MLRFADHTPSSTGVEKGLFRDERTGGSKDKFQTDFGV